MRDHLSLLGALGWIALTTGGCNTRTEVGSECAGGKCTPPIMCSAAKQELPVDCRNTKRKCSGGVVIAPDEQACTECGLTNERLGVKNTPIAACACAHCAAQIAACFDSAKTEPDGGARDTLCQAIVECGWANHCAGGECYCGAGVDRVTCLQDANSGRARGPCAKTIENAVRMVDGCSPGAPLGDCVLGNQLDATGESILSRATAVGQCVTGDPLLPNGAIEAMCPLDTAGIP
jgi:hypothetical protein